MSDFRQISETFFVSPQILPEDVDAAKALGFETLIMNRPDQEEPSQPPTTDIRAAADAAGMSFHYIPVSGPPRMSDIDATTAALAASDGKKVLAFCRSGTRCAILWAYSMAKTGKLDAHAIISATAGAGYDLRPHAQQLEMIAGA